jgi:hypothetical protein
LCEPDDDLELDDPCPDDDLEPDDPCPDDDLEPDAHRTTITLSQV